MQYWPFCAKISDFSLQWMARVATVKYESISIRSCTLLNDWMICSIYVPFVCAGAPDV